MRDRRVLWFFAFATSLLVSSAGRAAQVVTARASAAQVRLWENLGGKMTPVQTVPQGTLLQVTDTPSGAWRQVVIRETGKAARWGYVIDREVTVGAAPVAPQTPEVAKAAEATTNTPPDRAKDTKKNERLTLGLKAGYGLFLSSSVSGGFMPGLDLGVRLLGNRSGALFLELQVLTFWSSTVVGDMTVAGLSIFSLGLPTFLYLTGRNLFGSGFYTGAGAGSHLSVLSTTLATPDLVNGGTTVTNRFAFTPYFAFGAYLGYDIRPVPVLSFGPEIHYNGLFTGVLDAGTGAIAASTLIHAFAFLANVRFHF